MFLAEASQFYASAQVLAPDQREEEKKNALFVFSTKSCLCPLLLFALAVSCRAPEGSNDPWPPHLSNNTREEGGGGGRKGLLPKTGCTIIQ